MFDVKIKCLCLKYVEIDLEKCSGYTSHICPDCNISNANNQNLVV